VLAEAQSGTKGSNNKLRRRHVAAGGGYKVLIVSEEHSNSEPLAKVFFLRGNPVRTAYTAEQAIEIVAAWGPDLAIIDVVLPKMNGIDLAVLLRENYPACHVLLVSGQLLTSTLAEQMAETGHPLSILAKPVAVNDLLETATTLLSAKLKPDA
jgi:DNA-binding NtrC family response regulator